MTHLLIVSKGLLDDKEQTASGTKHGQLSRYYSGDVLQNVWRRDYITTDWGGFTLCGFYTPYWFYRIKLISSLWFYIHSTIRFAYRHLRLKRYDVVIAREPIGAGLLGVILSRMLGCKLIVELNGNYASSEIWKSTRGEREKPLKHRFVQRIVPFVLRRAHAIKVLYDEQLSPYVSKLDIESAQFVYRFHEFTQIGQIEPTLEHENYVLLLGGPAYIKGADVLVRAFNNVSSDFPDVKLKLVGWFQEEGTRELEALAGDNPDIEVCLPVNYDAAQELISKCTLLALPSRTEAMGRVLLEGMAHQKALIGSRVDGIPTYLHDGFNGLLVEPGNVEDLTGALRELLVNEDRRETMAKNGRAYVSQELSERRYVEHYRQAISEVLGSCGHS